MGFPTLYNVIVRHPRGGALASEQSLARDGKIRLQPWGRIEAVVLEEGKPKPHCLVEIGIESPRGYKRLIGQGDLAMHRYCQYAITDDGGKFTIEQSMAGRAHAKILSEAVANFQSSIPAGEFEIRPGETVRLKLQGEGRPVVGRLVAQGNSAAPATMDWSQYHLLLRPFTPSQGTALPRVIETWGKILVPGKDGAFRIPEVPPGKYNVILLQETEMQGRKFLALSREFDTTSGPREVVVPAAGKGGSGATFDLGTLEFRRVQTPDRPASSPQRERAQSQSGAPALAVGQPAPDFTFKDLDGKAHKLGDYRGKVVLLDFWATWCGPCRAETPALKEIWTAFGKDPRFAMISLSLDKEVAAPKDYAEKNGLSWIQGFLGEYKQTEVPKRYGVTGIPSIWVIGPDGRIAATGLRGGIIREGVAKALGKPPGESLRDYCPPETQDKNLGFRVLAIISTPGRDRTTP